MPNDLWCADFKGEFKLGNGRYCYPLTVTDHASRFLLLCEALESTREDLACTAFERLFRERGLPLAIRSDNGVPFASPTGLFNLSKLSVWWLSSPVAGSCQMSVNKLIGGLIGLMLGVAVVTFLACGGIEVRAEVAQQLAKDSASIGCP